jgi:CDP-glycerol glycerophosphotransferase (TagB/SpsB family)
VSEKDLLASLTDELLGYANLRWDNSAEPFASMRKADVLVSDLSGIVFDFAFMFEKPVVSMRFDYDETGMEASDLPGELWEIGVLDKIGFRIGEEDLETLPERIGTLVGTEELRDSIRLVMKKNLFNPGEAGRTAARQIHEIQKRVANPAVAPAADGSAAAVS